MQIAPWLYSPRHWYMNTNGFSDIFFKLLSWTVQYVARKPLLCNVRQQMQFFSLESYWYTAKRSADSAEK
uniref:AlNc14C280G10098 protein n=1 Tax=Albugo laibachii Nc14 TaxID=890382 RepID=F0WUV0_9STRA|nr:AlNc14C280G10098 [Albugo laibachii Nc14]|eukprot:CCA25186.1 AlNc14C280G10098 [Albugo laibachii Nc14]